MTSKSILKATRLILIMFLRMFERRFEMIENKAFCKIKYNRIYYQKSRVGVPQVFKCLANSGKNCKADCEYISKTPGMIHALCMMPDESWCFEKI